MSYPISVIKNDVERAIKAGCKEIQITAQDTASYGREKESSLSQLLQELIGIPGWFRLRIGMMNPATLFPQLDDLITIYQNPHIYKFLHIPVQSGDNELLQLMGRRYQIEDIKIIVNRFRKHIPDITISTDIIVGFPSETEAQFNNSKQFLLDIKPDIVNITKFSARPFTKAKKMKHRIPTDIVKRRSKELTVLTSSISKDKNRQYIGKEYLILITEEGKNHSMVGRTDYYKVVVLKQSVSLGDVVNVDIVDATETYLVGTLK